MVKHISKQAIAFEVDNFYKVCREGNFGCTIGFGNIICQAVEQRSIVSGEEAHTVVAYNNRDLDVVLTPNIIKNAGKTNKILKYYDVTKDGEYIIIVNKK